MRKRQKQTLLQFAMKKPMNVYQLWASMPTTDKGPRSSYQKSVNFLLKKGLIKIKENKTWFGDRIQKVYQITIEGLLEVLNEDTAWKHLDEIVDSNRDVLPEYFELWDTFRLLKVDDVATRLLAFAVENLRNGIPSFPEKIEGRKPTLRDWLPRLSIYPWEAFIKNVLTEKDMNRFTGAILQDPRIEKIYAETLRWMIDSHRSAMESFQKALDKYNELKYWSEAGKRVMEILRTDKTPMDKMILLRQDENLWKAITGMYSTKDEKELLAILEKLTAQKESELHDIAG